MAIPPECNTCDFRLWEREAEREAFRQGYLSPQQELAIVIGQVVLKPLMKFYSKIGLEL